MKWKKKRNVQRWESDAGYIIDSGPMPYKVLTGYRVGGPRAVEPPHYRTLVGGCNDLEQAKQMAEDHRTGCVPLME